MADDQRRANEGRRKSKEDAKRRSKTQSKVPKKKRKKWKMPEAAARALHKQVTELEEYEANTGAGTAAEAADGSGDGTSGGKTNASAGGNGLNDTKGKHTQGGNQKKGKQQATSGRGNAGKAPDWLRKLIKQSKGSSRNAHQERFTTNLANVKVEWTHEELKRWKQITDASSATPNTATPKIVPAEEDKIGVTQRFMHSRGRMPE